jgi:predicted dehydrogenase
MSQWEVPPLQAAIVGFGFIAEKGHLQAYLQRKDIQVVAVADGCEARLRLAERLIPGVRVYPDYLKLLEAESSSLDFLDICTPPADHACIAHAAFEKGLHVLCEKPLTTSFQQAQALLKHAELAERVLFPCHNYRYAPVVRAIDQILKSGKIGKVRSVTLNTYRNTHAKGVPEWKTHWRREKKISGGGIAMDHGSHSFYLIFDWMGGFPHAVTAKMATLDDRYDTEDSFTAVLSFPQAMAYAHLSWTAGVRKVIYTLQGEKGAITVDDDRLELALMQETKGPDVAQGAVTWNIERQIVLSDWMDASHVGWFQALLDQFQKKIQDREWVSQETREACFCIQLIAAAYCSAQEGCREISL